MRSGGYEPTPLGVLPRWMNIGQLRLYMVLPIVSGGIDVQKNSQAAAADTWAQYNEVTFRKLRGGSVESVIRAWPGIPRLYP